MSHSRNHALPLSGLQVSFHANPAHVTVAREGDRLGDRLGDELGETRAAIVHAMLADPRITTAQLSLLLGISTTAVDKNLRYLKEKGYITRRGPARGGVWEVNERR